MIATISNLDLQISVITTMCDMTYEISPLTYEIMITVVEIVRKSSCSSHGFCRTTVVTTHQTTVHFSRVIIIVNYHVFHIPPDIIIQTFSQIGTKLHIGGSISRLFPTSLKYCTDTNCMIRLTK